MLGTASRTTRKPRMLLYLIIALAVAITGAVLFAFIGSDGATPAQTEMAVVAGTAGIAIVTGGINLYRSLDRR